MMAWVRAWKERAAERRRIEAEHRAALTAVSEVAGRLDAVLDRAQRDIGRATNDGHQANGTR